jgi:RNA polymerase sigma factor (sigma-70 family)
MGSENGESRSDSVLLAGDADAFAEFYRRNEDALVAYFLRRVATADVAADLTAETFARALEGRAGFDPALGDGRGWLFGIARHVLARSVERGRVENETRVRLGMEPLTLDDDDIARIDELAGAPAVEALSALSDAQRRAIAGRVIEERDYDELARSLGCSESVVRKRVSRGLKSLRAELESSS